MRYYVARIRCFFHCLFHMHRQGRGWLGGLEEISKKKFAVFCVDCDRDFFGEYGVVQLVRNLPSHFDKVK